ncbi:SCO2322 family protein [Streptomyces sp. NPDC012935]|uniref:SCO2322 family protein n=1 Tax=Streptomyces sp. NPDC012935 TaxID=3364857 RepID=UPI0036CF5C12
MIRRALTLLLVALVLVTGAAQAAQAAGYRYWSFWDRDGAKWTYATQGPSTARPSDGDVQGFRFAVSEDSKDAAQPSGAAEFEVICARTPAQDGKKRVALVIDFGTAADAPSGETPPARRTVCARVAPDATTAEALATVAKPLRYATDALLCAIGGYPEKGCGEQMAGGDKSTASEGTPSEQASSAKKDASDDGPSLGLVAGIGVVAVLGAAAVWQARRRRT